MSFKEKVFIVCISVGLSFLCNLALHIISRTFLKKKQLDCAKEKLGFFASKMEIAIANNDTNSVAEPCKTLMENFCVFSKIDTMVEDFHKLYNIFIFMENSGYTQNKKRKEKDLNIILTIKQRWNKN